MSQRNRPKTPSAGEGLNVDPACDRALRGEIIYGDDFDREQIAAWFRDEEDAYHDLYFRDENEAGKGERDYEYSALVEEHNYRWIRGRRFGSILGIGSADGAELRPLLDRADSVTILEASDKFASSDLDGRRVTYVKPAASGVMPFADGGFDLVVCFSALHHIPNVSFVISEMHRVCRQGAVVLLREPVHSMGDWRTSRRGLTKRERGIPEHLFVAAAKHAGFEVARASPCMFPLIPRVANLIGVNPLRSRRWTTLDRWLCGLPIWSRAYHPTNVLQRFRPHSLALVLRRR